MVRKLAVLLLALLLSRTGAALALEGAYLSGEALKSIQPAFEVFLEALADALAEEGLLPAEDREAWLLYQIGDFLQNGGYGSIAVAYTPGLLTIADTSVAARRMTARTRAGTVYLETLSRYRAAYSPLPGLPLYTEMLDDGGAAVPCRFRWIAPEGSLMFWDGLSESVVNVGATYINDSKPLYWYVEPVEGVDITLTLEILSLTEDEMLARVDLTLISGPDYWEPEELR